MTIDTVITALFVLIMIANIIALMRHWMMMRVMNIVLNNLAKTQAQFNEIMEAQKP